MPLTSEAEIDSWPDVRGVGRTERVDEPIRAMRDGRTVLDDEH